MVTAYAASSPKLDYMLIAKRASAVKKAENCSCRTIVALLPGILFTGNLLATGLRLEETGYCVQGCRAYISRAARKWKSDVVATSFCDSNVITPSCRIATP